MNPLVSLNQFDEKPTISIQPLVICDEKVGFTTTLKIESIGLLASGTAIDQRESLSKAYSELLERLVLMDKNTDQLAWKFDVLPTTDCMAAGFDPALTVTRSNFEAIERYVRVLFGQGLCGLKQLSSEEDSLILKACEKEFDKTATYFQKISYMDYSKNSHQVFFICAVGYFKDRVVFGFSVHADKNEGKEHAYVELLRNKNTVIIYEAGADKEFVNKKYYEKLVAQSKNVGRWQHILSRSQLCSENLLQIPNISWQKLGKLGNAFVCRSFVVGYLEAEKSKSFGV